jgi:hypothetical protein
MPSGATASPPRASPTSVVTGGGDVEGGQPPAEGLRDDEHVAEQHHAVGEEQVVGDGLRGAVGVDAGHGRPGDRVAGHEVEAEVADVGAAPVVDDHVVEVLGDEPRQVGVLDQRPVVLAAQDAVVTHRDDEHPPVGEEAEAGGLPGDLRHHLVAAAGLDRDDPLGVEVRDPQPALVPARALQVRPPVGHHVEVLLPHGALLLEPT